MPDIGGATDVLSGKARRLANLCKPWTRETRPADQTPKHPGRNKRAKRDERLGRLLRNLYPDLVELAWRVRAVVLPKIHATALKRLSADPATAGDAMRLATLVALGAAIVTGARPAPHSGSTCPRCKRSLFGVAGDPLPLMLGGGPVGWYHPTCLTGALAELVGRARVRVTAALDKASKR